MILMLLRPPKLGNRRGKMMIIDLTELEAERKANPHPCDGCLMGYGGIGQFTDTKTGHLVQVSHDCTKDCQWLKRYEKTL
jgi:hypothetical protein